MTLSVLIVEDDVIIGMLLGDLLADMGHEVCAVATTAAEAAAAAAHFGPGLIIIDVNLGRENGVAAADAICALSPVPCIFVSGDAAVLATLSHRSVVMRKPYQRWHIERAIADAVGTRHGLNQ